MAAPRLFAKTDLAGLEPVTMDGRPVLLAHARLAALIAARGGPAGLFAEPVLTRGTDGQPSAVSWYGEGEGEPQTLSALSPARRAEAEAALRHALAALVPALDDPEDGPWLRRALLLADPESVLVIGRGLLLTGWGLAPRGTGEDPAALAARLRDGLGRYLPALADAGPGLFASRPAPLATAPAAARPAAGPAAAMPTRSDASPATPPAPAAAASAGGWWLLPSGLLVAITFLLLGFWLGWRAAVGEWTGRELVATVVEETPHRLALAQAREANAVLEREIAAARAALAGEICRPEGPLPRLAPDPATTPIPASPAPASPATSDPPPAPEPPPLPPGR